MSQEIRSRQKCRAEFIIEEGALVCVRKMVYTKINQLTSITPLLVRTNSKPPTLPSEKRLCIVRRVIKVKYSKNY